MRLLVTGGAGFIGSNLIRYLLNTDPDVQIINLDLLTYAGNLENLQDVVDDRRYRFVHGDICDQDLVMELARDLDAILNLAAESHVDRSILSATPFVQTNVLGTQNLLAAALASRVPRFIQVSTDEVYGELPWADPELHDPDRTRFTEDTPLSPRSPYSASKASADLLALSYHTTHALDIVVTRCSNNYGPFQFPEKLIPLMVTNALHGKELPIYGDGLNVRDWIHVADHCRGIHLALLKGKAGRVYNFGGNAERTNLRVVRTITSLLETSGSLIRLVEDRRGHDRRYAVDSSRAQKELGWEPRVPFEEGLKSTVDWYSEHRGWWERVKSGEYREFYEDMYGEAGPHSARIQRGSPPIRNRGALSTG